MKIINGESFPDLKVSPNYGSDKLESGKLEDKIDVFEDQVSGWILDHAIRLTSPEYSGPPGGDMAGLILALTYFESIAQFMRGGDSEGKSVKYFEIGFKVVFPEVEGMASTMGLPNEDAITRSIVGAFYKQLRCGFFHSGAMGNLVVVVNTKVPLRLIMNKATGQVGAILVTPSKFIARMRDHFNLYCAQLRDPRNTLARLNFGRFWDLRASKLGAIIPSAKAMQGMTRYSAD